METVELTSLEATAELARRLVAELKPGSGATVWALSGDLGSGKTAFSQAAARVLGIGEVVTSPTFVIEKIYQIPNGDFNRLIHLDCYRLKGRAELEQLGWDNLIADPQHLILVEWPERVGDLIIPDLLLSFKFINESTRQVTINGEK